MKALLVTALLPWPAIPGASVARIMRPSTARTYSFSDVTRHSLQYDAGSRQLLADTTFSNQQWDGIHPRFTQVKKSL